MPETGGGTELRGGPLPAALARFDLGRRGELAPESRAIDDGGAAARVGLGCRSQLAPEHRPARRLTACGGFPVTERAKSPRPAITRAPNDRRRLSPRPATTTSPTPGAERPRPRGRRTTDAGSHLPPHRRSRRSTPATRTRVRGAVRAAAARGASVDGSGGARPYGGR